MAPRTILYTGKGGVGKSSVAAATARRCAADGRRTLVLSTGPELAVALGVAVGPQSGQAGPRLWAQQLCARVELERHWGAMRARVGGVPAPPVAAGALAAPPGLGGLLGLLAVKDHHDSGAWDVIVIDWAPPDEALRLLTLPDVARWWLDRVLAPQGRLLDAARPLARALLDLGLPGEAVLDEIGGLARSLVGLSGILRDHDSCSARLVMAPEGAGVGEARRTLTHLHLQGLLVDAVVVNRVLPPEAGAYFASWRARQQEHLHAIGEGLAPVPVLRAPFFTEEVVGPATLDQLSDALFGDDADPAAVLHAQSSEELVMGRDGATLRLALPFAARAGLGLKRIGSDLVVAVDGHRRTLPLPPALADYRATGARFDDGSLLVAFDLPA